MHSYVIPKNLTLWPSLTPRFFPQEKPSSKHRQQAPEGGSSPRDAWRIQSSRATLRTLPGVQTCQGTGSACGVRTLVKSMGNHRFSHEICDFPVFFPFNQSIHSWRINWKNYDSNTIDRSFWIGLYRNLTSWVCVVFSLMSMEMYWPRKHHLITLW